MKMTFQEIRIIATGLCIDKCIGKNISGADPGFQVRGGALKNKCAERREARKLLEYFV